MKTIIENMQQNSEHDLIQQSRIHHTYVTWESCLNKSFELCNFISVLSNIDLHCQSVYKTKPLSDVLGASQACKTPFHHDGQPTTECLTFFHSRRKKICLRRLFQRINSNSQVWKTQNWKPSHYRWSPLRLHLGRGQLLLCSSYLCLGKFTNSQCWL